VTSPLPTVARRLPGGRARKIVARLLPRGFKASLRRRFRGSYLFPAPPPKPARGRGPAREPVPRVVTVPLPRRGGEALVLQAPKNLLVPRRLEKDGLAGYEPYAMECFLTLLDTAGPGGVIDVGANVGLYALLAAACSDRDVRAFEPTPDLAAVARATADRNGLRVVVEELALGREQGTATLFLSDASDSSNSLAEDYRPSSGHMDVTVDTLDAYCARSGVVPAVLKVDTETTEPDVLAGAAVTISRHRPWILCEVLYRRRAGELAEVMAPHGYTWYHLSGDAGQEPVATLDGDPEHVHLMYLLAPEPVDAAFWARTAQWRAALDATRAEPAEVVPG
jgi:FkbM family methyltransferase